MYERAGDSRLITIEDIFELAQSEAETIEAELVTTDEEYVFDDVPVYQQTQIAHSLRTPDPEIEEQEEYDMSALDDSITQLLAIEGATGAAIVDYSSGMALAQGGNPGFDLGVAAAGNSNVVSAKLRTMADLALDSHIEDILITLGTQYHLINVLNAGSSKGLFVYLVLDRTYANLALARHKLTGIAAAITV